MRHIRVSQILAVMAGCGVLLLGPSGRAAAQPRQVGGVGITVFGDIGFGGTSATIRNDVPNLQSVGFNDQISSLRVARGEMWEACTDINYRGRCQVFSDSESDLRPGGWSDTISSLRRVRNSGGRGGRGGFIPPPPPPPRGGLELFSRPGFEGERRLFTSGMGDLQQVDFNDQAMSLRIGPRETWQVCGDANFQSCVVVTSNQQDLARLGMMRRISSVRPWTQGRPPRPRR
jgi:hypothetical protein